MLDEYLKQRGADKFEITYTYPIGRLHGLEPVAQWAVPEFERRGIKSQTFFNTKEVDAKNKTITSEEGDTLEYDLLITIPPHRGAQVIEDSGLGQAGWIPTNPKTLLREGSNNVFVIGDTTNIPISKAGSTAHFQADIIVENLTMMAQEGRWLREYDGKVFCFIETGISTGTYIWFNYKTPPKPTPPTQMVHWAKLDTTVCTGCPPADFCNRETRGVAQWTSSGTVPPFTAVGGLGGLGEAAAAALTDAMVERRATTVSTGLEILDRVNDPDTRAALHRLIDDLTTMHITGLGGRLHLGTPAGFNWSGIHGRLRRSASDMTAHGPHRRGRRCGLAGRRPRQRG